MFANFHNISISIFVSCIAVRLLGSMFASDSADTFLGFRVFGNVKDDELIP